VTEGSAERTAAPHSAAVVFDLDGTLVDSRADIVDAVAFALAEHRATPRSPAEIASYVGDGARLLVARALGLRADDARVDAVLATFLARYEAHPADSTVPMPGALDALDALSALPLAVCTNKPRRVTELVLGHLGLTARFDVLVAGGDVGRGKPSPEPLLLAAERLGFPAERVVMVGDGVQDVECGRAAGALTVAVLGGFGAEATLRAARPDRIIATLLDLPALVLP
jgi:phosphoglycolate phosphatase